MARLAAYLEQKYPWLLKPWIVWPSTILLCLILIAWAIVTIVKG